MQQHNLLPASIKKTYADHVWKDTGDVFGNYYENEKEFKSTGEESTSIQMSTKEHVENAHLIYYIDQPDARITYKKNGNIHKPYI